jgi:hypothetical protein
MNFNDLDDVATPSTADAREKVSARARQLRTRRRALFSGVAATTAIVCAFGSMAYASDNGHRANVAVPPKQDETATTTTDDGTGITTPTTESVATTTTIKPTRRTHGGGSNGPDATTVPNRGDNSADISMVHVQFLRGPLAIAGGDSAPVSYTVTNDGTWTVRIPRNPSCVGAAVWVPEGNRLWPVPVPMLACTPTTPSDPIILAPGASYSETDTVHAGIEIGVGTWLPSPPGDGFYYPFAYETAPFTLPVHVTASPNPPFTDTRPTDVTIRSGDSKDLSFAVTNNLDIEEAFVSVGPQISGGDNQQCDDSPNVNLAHCRFTVLAHQTVTLTAHVHAISADSGPLAPGEYDLEWNELTLHLTVTP